MIKKTLFVVGVAIVVAAVAVLSVGSYKNYQNKHKPVPTVTVAQKNAEVASAEDAVKQSAGAEYQALHVECEKGLAAYNALPVASKAKTPQPQCGPAVLR